MVSRSRTGPVNHAVVGLGHIAQVAVLPGFKHARGNSRLAALVSGDSTKRRRLSKKYREASNGQGAGFERRLTGCHDA
jgi:predicted dehydrogenase